MAVDVQKYTGQLVVMRAYGQVKAGDLKINWNKSDDKEVDEARKAFDDHIAKGGLAYTAYGKNFEKGEQIKKFDPNAERIVLVPQMVGG